MSTRTRPAWIPHPSADTPSHYVERGLTIFSILWQGAWTLSELLPRAISTGSPIVAGAVSASVAGFLGVALALWGPASLRACAPLFRALDLSLLLGCVLVLSWTSVGSGWPVASLMSVISCAVAALTLRAWPAACVIAATTVLSSAELILLSGVEALNAAMYSLFGAALGCGAMVLAWGLRTTGRRLDRAHAAQVDADALVEAQREVARATLQHESRLHDRVLNTLSAIARGGLDAHGDDVRARCAQAAAELRSLTQAHPTLPRDAWDDVRQQVGALRAQGVDVDHDPLDDGSWGLPRPVAQSLGTAVGEALRNVLVHADASHVSVRIEASPVRAAIEVVDDGVGVGAHVGGGGLGIRGSIVGALRAIGGTAAIDSLPRGGTRVGLEWAEPVMPDEDTAFQSDVLSVLPQIAPPFLLTFLVYGTVVLLASLVDYAYPAWALGALVSACVLAIPLGLVPGIAARVGLTGSGSRRGPRVILGMSLAVVAPLVVYTCEMTALAGAPLPPWGIWSSEVSLALLFTAVVLGPRWTIVPALAAWVVAQGGSLWELVRPGSVMLVIAAIFTASMHRRARQYAVSRRRVIASRATEESQRVDAQRRRARYAPVERYVLPLLQGIANGSLDYGSDEIRARCALEERFARSMTRLDPTRDDLSAALAAAVVSARDSAVFIDADITQAVPSGTPVSLAGPVESILGLPAGTSVRVTAGWEDDRVVVRLTSPDESTHLYCEWELTHVS